MGDELPSFERRGDEFLEVGHSPQRGQGRFLGLFHGADQYLFQPGGLYLFSFREAAVQAGDGIDADLGRFLGEPFHTIHVLGGGHGDV